MKEKFANTSNNFSKKFWKAFRITLIIIPLIAILIYILSLPNITSVDFATLRDNISNYGLKQDKKDGGFASSGMGGMPQTASETEELRKQQEERSKYVSENRASMFVESATEDYHHGDYEEALRRLERALLYDQTNFTAFKLMGQIYFEHNQYRKAFNSWEKANQIPHDDKTLARDLEVLRKLLRYSRKEIDALRHKVNLDPSDLISNARLQELEERVKD